MSPRYVAVTGCAGFIGRVVTRKLLERGDYVYGIDALTYAADPQFIDTARQRWGDHFCPTIRDIRELGRFPDVDAVLHLAAETHVDNSLVEASRFTEVNVLGTQHLLDMTLAKKQHGMPRFVYVSTDEVYGSITDGWMKAKPGYPLRPSSPYAASKAAADLLVQSYGHTFDMPYTILRPTNVYGANQYAEKFLPKAVRSLMLGRKIPVHGTGLQTRQWLHVDDCAEAIIFAMDNAETLPPILNISGNTEASVGEIARTIVDCFYDGDDVAYTDHIAYGHTRPGMDTRYSVCDAPLRKAGWTPLGDFWAELPGLVRQERSRFRH